MYVNRFDLTYLSLARAGGLPLHAEGIVHHENADLLHHQQRLELLREEERARARHARHERRTQRRLLFRRALGRILARGGQRLSGLGTRLAAPQAAQTAGCG